MNYLIITIILSLSIYGDEINRMEKIVRDIENLRSEYNKCKKELNIKSIVYTLEKKNIDDSKFQNIQVKNTKIREYKKLLNKERLKNTMLLVKIDTLKKKKVSQNIKNSNNEIEIKDLKKQYALEVKNKEKIIKILKKKKDSITKIVAKDESTFPSLVIKESLKSQMNKIIELEFPSKALTYRLNKSSNIYSNINATNIVYRWKENTLFTSNALSQNRVKITGYFKNDKWQKAKKELWIKKINVAFR